MSVNKSIYTTLNRRGGRTVLAAGVSAIATLKTGRRCHISFEQGLWICEWSDGTLVEPELTLLTLPDIRRRTYDYAMHQYVPSEGDVVLDIGAATGWETLAFSKCVGQRGHVISVEAHPRTFFCLQEMCRRNKLKNVTLFNCAATATEAVVYLSDRPLYVANSIVQNGSGSSVRGRTIASIFSEFNFSRVDLLKMDIEGAERGAIEGLDNVIEKTRYVCIECHDFLATHRGAEDMRTRSTVIEFLKAKGFEIVLRDSDPRPHIRDTVYGSNTRLNSDEEVRRGALASY